MPYVGGSLTSLFNHPQQRKTRDVMHRMVSRASGVWVKTTIRETPVDTGLLRQGWFQLPVTATPESVSSGVGTFVDYAPHVEYGTGLWGPKAAKYPITPKKPGGWLRWYGPDGRPIFARRVMHPGSPGRYMLHKGGDAALAAVKGGLLAADLTAWAEAIAREAD